LRRTFLPDAAADLDRVYRLADLDLGREAEAAAEAAEAVDEEEEEESGGVGERNAVKDRLMGMKDAREDLLDVMLGNTTVSSLSQPQCRARRQCNAEEDRRAD
jgi:hypothetical protein